MDSEELNKRHTWNSSTKYALGCYRMLGRCLGIWPSECQNIGAKGRFTFAVSMQLLMFLRLTGSLLTKGNCGAVVDIVDALSVAVGGFLGVMKMIIPRIHRENMLLVVNSAVDDWSLVHSKRSGDVMMKYAYIGRLVFFVQMCGICIAGFPLAFMRLPVVTSLWSDANDSSRQWPFGPSCWISDDMSTFYYIGDYSLQIIQLFIVCVAYIGGDTYFFGVAMHVCGQFELLNMSLENLYGCGDTLKQKQKLDTFIKRHNHLLDLANHFEETYNIIILAQVAGIVLLICISGIVLLMNLGSGDFVIIIGMIVRIFLVCVQLFIYCYVGEQLSVYADKLENDIYNCPWYNMSLSIVQDMRFIIMRNNYRFQLTAGKMYSMNIENFKNVMKTMGSYFSVLRLAFQDSE